MLALSLSSRSLRSYNGITLLVPRVMTSAGARAFHSCAPSVWYILQWSFHSASSVATFTKHHKVISLTWPFPIDTSMADDPLILQNCTIDFDVVYWFGCCATAPGHAGDNGDLSVFSVLVHLEFVCKQANIVPVDLLNLFILIHFSEKCVNPKLFYIFHWLTDLIIWNDKDIT